MERDALEVAIKFVCIPMQTGYFVVFRLLRLPFVLRNRHQTETTADAMLRCYMFIAPICGALDQTNTKTDKSQSLRLNKKLLLDM